jgi:3-oxoacyl-[acyl-carrier protein] reductase
LAGARLVLADIDRAGLETTAAAVRMAGVEALVCPTDVSQLHEMEALADFATRETGHLDIWLNGAGVSCLGTILDSDPEQMARTVNINMMGSYWGCRAAGRIMRERKGGAIVNFSSGGGAKPLPGMALYAMTKAAVNSLTQTCAAEFGPFGIRVNAVAPGWIETPMSSVLFRDEHGQFSEALRDKVRVQMASRSPLGILGVPSDIAFAMLYLAGDASRFVTGQVITVNGGESI